ncbi:MAG: hypothetical protein H6564_20645 [Lewinellaceae bacterium]|nr:hypothetical protein [Lewinellaceae bacterium]
MIVPMRKYAFLAHCDDYERFLEQLHQLGVLHVQERREKGEGEELNELLWKEKEVASAIRLLEGRKAEAAESAYDVDGQELAGRIMALQDKREDTEQLLNAQNRQLGELAPWGDFSLDTLKKLEEAGWKVRLFTTTTRKFDPSWKGQHYLWPISSVPPLMYFALAHRVGEEPGIDAEEVSWPAQSPAVLRAARDRSLARLEEIGEELDGYAARYLPLLREALLKIQEKVDWKRVFANTDEVADGRVMVLEGFVPTSREQGLRAYLDGADVVYFSEQPVPEDHPPVLLKNGRFSRLFEPISKLFALPAYQELDLTPFFAPFFMLFFGFCLGDAGYGLAVLLGATLYKRKASAELKPIITLAQLLGLSTILMGAFTGTVFGLNLLEAQYAWLGNVRSFMIDSNQAFNFALILGVVQILFGLCVQAGNRVRQYGWVYAIPIMGWILLLLSILDLALLKLTGQVSTYTAWAGVAMIVLFSDPKANIFSRLGKGLWDLYGITGFFGDLLSYIRLFALGISSAILGFVVNDIALQIKGAAPVIGPILFVIFLIIGHGANLLISALGSFVHPMRLTFVEFYKNAGFLGGGKAYTPFASRLNKENHKNEK